MKTEDDKYYAIAIESSYYVKKGQYEKLKNLDEALKVKKEGKCKFWYTENMHYDYDILQCKVIKKEIKYSEL